MPNQNGLHCRELIEVQDIDESQKRWLLKTYNFASTNVLEGYSEFFGEMEGLVIET